MTVSPTALVKWAGRRRVPLHPRARHLQGVGAGDRVALVEELGDRPVDRGEGLEVDAAGAVDRHQHHAGPVLDVDQLDAGGGHHRFDQGEQLDCHVRSPSPGRRSGHRRMLSTTLPPAARQGIPDQNKSVGSPPTLCQRHCTPTERQVNKYSSAASALSRAVRQPRRRPLDRLKGWSRAPVTVPDGHLALVPGGPVAPLHDAPRQRTWPPPPPDGEAQQFGVLELDPRRHVPVVVEHLDPGPAASSPVEPVGRLGHLGGASRPQGQAGGPGRGPPGRPGQPLVVVVLLGHHRQQTADPHAVAAHGVGGLAPVLGHEGGAGHHVGVLGAQLEGVGRLHRADQAHRIPAAGAQVAVHHLDERPPLVDGEVAAEHHPAQVVVGPVGTGDPPAGPTHPEVGHHPEPQRPGHPTAPCTPWPGRDGPRSRRRRTAATRRGGGPRGRRPAAAAWGDRRRPPPPGDFRSSPAVTVGSSK